MIVDFHSHDFPDALAVKAMRGMCQKTDGILYPAGDGTMANHLDAMALYGVDRSVLCQIATRPEHWEVILRRSRAILAGEFGERARAALIPFASVHPADELVEAHLEAIAAAGLRGVKFHPYYQGFSLVDSAVLRMFEKIAELGLVVECHTGGDVSWKNLLGRCGPGEVAALVRRVPQLKLVAAHLGGCFRHAPHAVDALADLGVYIDTSALHCRWHYDEEMRLLAHYPAERLLFATDFPWVHYPEALANVRRLRPERDWPAVFGGNALKLLGFA